MALKVLMVGGRRCGKTSALAVMFDQMIKGAAKEFLTTCDATVYNIGFGESQNTLSRKVLELKRFLSVLNTRTFLCDTYPIPFEEKYTLRCRMPETTHSFDMEFTNIPGELLMWENNTIYKNPIIDRIRENDVILVAIDTPYLMESNDYINEAVNCVQEIQSYLMYLTNQDSHSSVMEDVTSIFSGNNTYSKMVLFVPIKCEKWVKEGRIDEVANKVKSTYDTTIKMLSEYLKMSICILPIETSGNIHFAEMKEALKLNDNSFHNKCCRVSDKIIRMYDGKLKQLQNDDRLYPDLDAYLLSGIIKPYAWFHIDNTTNTKGYSPHNCNQLALHILRYYVHKALNETSGVFGGSRWSHFFGNVTKDEIKRILKEIGKSNIIKENIDGIEYIMKDF